MTDTEKVIAIDKRFITLKQDLFVICEAENQLDVNCSYAESLMVNNQIKRLRNRIFKITKYRYQLVLA